MGKYKGNTTLYENKALTSTKPKTASTIGDNDYNATLARVFAGMEQPTKGPKAKGAKDPMAALPGALPDDIPLAGKLCVWQLQPAP